MTAQPSQGLDALGDLLGHHFKDIALLERALTHSSVPAVIEGQAQSYQRLEFLGDRVLGLVVADLVFSRFPDADEGELSRRLTRLVRKETCAKVASAIGLGGWIIMGEGEDKSGGRSKTAILGDACEAVIAALYLDGGAAAASRFITSNWERFLDDDAPLRDAKTALQEWAHKRGFTAPVYRVVDQTGPDHSPEFTIEVVVPGGTGEIGRGRSKRAAEQAAARAVLEREGAWSVP